MEYIGAADYYFWQGIKVGMKTPIKDLDSVLPNLYIFGNNETTRECYKAFEWGLCFSIILTQEEYLDLTISPVHVSIKDIDEAFDETYKELNIEGNC